MTKLEIERVEAEAGTIVVYRLDGWLSSTTESYRLLEEVKEDVRHGKRGVLIDISRIEHMSSAGVGILAACFTSVMNAGGRMVLSGGSKRSLVLLNVVKLLDVIPHFETEPEALASLRS
ncbi:MAG: STAS domain-containing protein [Candidatus Eisenbacteria bacterium]|nr:STAS domain-containing protein [Candidatus Eisenbacteria bacterium]